MTGKKIKNVTDVGLAKLRNDSMSSGTPLQQVLQLYAWSDTRTSYSMGYVAMPHARRRSLSTSAKENQARHALTAMTSPGARSVT